jgi:hypothetical protein
LRFAPSGLRLQAIPKRCEAMRERIASSLALLAMTILTSRARTID